MTPDVNVLVAAARSDHPHHGIARTWLEKTLAEAGSGVVCTLMPMVVSSFLRLVTSPKIFQRPTSIDDAIGFIDALLTLPGAQLTEIGAEKNTTVVFPLPIDLISNLFGAGDADFLAAKQGERGTRDEHAGAAT